MRRFRRLLLVAILIGVAAFVLLPSRGVRVEQGSKQRSELFAAMLKAEQGLGEPASMVKPAAREERAGEEAVV